MDNKSTPYAYSISKIGSTYKPTMKPGDIIEYRDYHFQTPCFALVTDVHPNREHPIFCDEIAHFSLHGSYHTYPSFANFKRVAELKPDGHHVPITHPGELLWKDKDGFNYLKGSLKKRLCDPDMFNSFVNDVAEAWSDTKKRVSSYSTSQHYSSTVKVQNSLGHIYDASQLKQASESPDNFNSFANDVGTVWSDIPEKRASSYSATGDDSKIDVQNSLGHIYNAAPLKPAPKPPIFLLSDSEDSSQEGDFVSFHTKRTKNSGPYSSKPSGSGSASKPSASKSHLVKVTYEKGSKDAIPIPLQQKINCTSFNSLHYNEIFVGCNHFQNYSLPANSTSENFDGNLSSYFPVGSIWSSSNEVLSQLKQLSSKFLGYDSVNKRSSSSFICSNAKDHNCEFKLNLIAVFKYTTHEDNTRRHLWDHLVKISSFKSHSESCLTKKKREIVLESSSASKKKKSKKSIPSQWNVSTTPSFLVPNIIETEISKALARYVANIKHAILIADATNGEDTAIANVYRHCLERLLHVITHDNTISFQTLNSPGSAAFLDTVRNLKSYTSIGPAMMSVLCWLQSCNIKENSIELEVKLIGKQFKSQHYMNWKKMNAVSLLDHLNYKSV